ncbi:MAG TPA: hypothetical protein VKJ01_14455, partial [Candidatus Solibacter sp.]|nr:hypothetical protein [Candidatus Solibacter sp.]
LKMMGAMPGSAIFMLFPPFWTRPKVPIIQNGALVVRWGWLRKNQVFTGIAILINAGAGD